MPSGADTEVRPPAALVLDPFRGMSVCERIGISGPRGWAAQRGGGPRMNAQWADTEVRAPVALVPAPHGISPPEKFPALRNPRSPDNLRHGIALPPALHLEIGPFSCCTRGV